MKNPIDHHLVNGVLASLLALVALIAAVNAWTYSHAAAIPLVQSDAWVFLDTYVRKYLEGNFGWRDYFLQAFSSDTNLPLHKLILMFHINHFHMDFKVEGLIGTASAIAMVVLLVVAAAGPNPARWRLPGFALLAWLALAALSLNTSNVYTWPLVTMWFLNLLIVSAYLVFIARPSAGPVATLIATLVLGLLLDEVALITVIAAVMALLIQRDGRPHRTRLLQAGAAVAGVVIVRGLYAWFNAAHGMDAQPGPAPGLSGLLGLVAADALSLVSIPLSDSLLHHHALLEWFPKRHATVAGIIAGVLALLHLWFWWQAFSARAGLHVGTIATRRVAIALMLFFYGMVAGIALQRISLFGVEYLHQPRYVLFYQLNLVALGLMAYAAYQAREQQPRGWLLPVLLPMLMVVTLAAMASLQWHLAQRSWAEVKYLFGYMEGSARTLGTLAADPAADVPCADILRVCDFGPAKREELLDLLQVYQLNVFNPDFQGFYRLRPIPHPARAASAGSASAAPGE